MEDMELRFSGNVPSNYERYMVPLLFRPYAEELAARAKALQPRRILETAAGTGVVSDALAEALPNAEIVATDLNQPMLDVAAKRVKSANVRFQQADALDLPFEDGEFDLVVCQFGVMFFPDKVRGAAEARRVLSDGGHYLFAVWDSIDRNGLSDIANRSLHDIYPDNPPKFMERGPFSYHEQEWIERDLRAGGFTAIDIDTVKLTSRAPSAEAGARGYVYGSPMGVELADYGDGALDRVFERVRQDAKQFEGPNGFEAPMSAHIVTARK
jgi:ubiquinone/menaquinone biosynthesis C-methylase UbiE